jgi:CBS domain-containing protein
MLTDRDICMHAWSQGRPLRELSVRGAMSPSLVACRPADSVASAESLMQAHQIRRLPVLDPSGHPVGFFSLSDLTREVLLEQDRAQRELSDDDVVRTFAAVTQPRRDSRSNALEGSYSESRSRSESSTPRASSSERRSSRDSMRRPSAGA